MKKTIAKIMASTILAATLADCSHSNSISTGSMAASEKTRIEGATSEATEAEEEGAGTAPYKLAFLPNMRNNTFQAVMNDTLKKSCDEKRYGYVCLGPDYDLNIQLSQMAGVATQSFDAVFVIPVDSVGIRQGLEQIREKNILILSVDAPVTDDDLDLVEIAITTDAYNVGTLVGQQMVVDYPDEAKIAILDFPSNRSYVNRVAGLPDGLGDVKNKFDTVAQQDDAAAFDIPMPITENVIQTNPDLNAFFCTNDPSVLGVAAAIKAPDETGIGVYSTGTSPDDRAIILGGPFMIVAVQVPIGIVEAAFGKAEELLTGGEIEKEILLPPFPADKEKAEAALKDWQ